MQIFDLYTANLDGTKLIEASAGTGKTFTLAGLYIRYIVEKKLTPEQVLVLTFTTAATAELKTRLREQLIHCKNHLLQIELVSEADNKALYDLYESYRNHESAIKHIELALICFDQAAIYTINGFCQKVIDDFNSECGSPVLQELMVKKHYVKKFVYEFWRIQQKAMPIEFLATIPAIDKVIIKINSLLNKSHYQQVKPVIDWMDTGKIFNDYCDLKKQWQEQEETLLDYLLSGDFHGGVYKRANRETYKNDMVRFFSGFDGNILKFCASYIESKLKKNISMQPLPIFFNIFENFYEHVIYTYKGTTTGNNLAISYMYSCFNYVQDKLLELRTQEGKFDYSDQIKVVHDGILNNPNLVDNIANHWQCIMVDEFQDTDSMQLEIFDKCFNNGKHDLVYVGDPKQAIYDFRGADVFVYNQAKQTTTHQFNLATNWRSSDKMLATSNAMFDFENSFKFSWLKFTPSLPKREQEKQLTDIYPPVALLDCMQEQRRSLLAQEIKRFLMKAEVNNEKIKPENCAILVNFNKDAIELYEYLLSQDVSVSLWSESSVFATQVAKQLYYVIRAINYPSESNIFTTLHGIFFALSLNQLHKSDKQELVSTFVNYRLEVETAGMVKVIEKLFTDKHVNNTLLQHIEGERHFTDLQQLMELLQEQVDSGNNPNQLEQWLAMQIQQVESVEDDEQRKRRIESDSKKMAIMTIHKSKGLEFDHVFIPFADKITDSISRDNINLRACLATHDEKNNGVLYWRHSRAAQDSHAVEKRAENIRNLYVAITRAKYRVYLGVDTEAKQYNKLPIAQLIDKVKDDAKLSAVIDAKERPYPKSKSKKVELAKPRLFKRNLQKPQSIYSFSALSNKQTLSYESFDEITGETNYSNYFQFPKGAKSGTMQHEILENLSFNADLDEIETEVKTQLEKNNYHKKWLVCLSQQIYAILNTKLWQNGARLSEISNHVDEMEFMLPVGSINHNTIAKWLSAHRGIKTIFTQDNLQGFLTGFIDLVFEYKNKYYVIDYKSNYLGASFTDYTKEKLQNAIEHHFYDLQYLLYTVALVKYLATKIDNFDYQTHFGGIAYIFTRGIDGNAGQGVYTNKAQEELIKTMIGNFNAS